MKDRNQHFPWEVLCRCLWSRVVMFSTKTVARQNPFVWSLMTKNFNSGSAMLNRFWAGMLFHVLDLKTYMSFWHYALFNDIMEMDWMKENDLFSKFVNVLQNGILKLTRKLALLDLQAIKSKSQFVDFKIVDKEIKLSRIPWRSENEHIFFCFFSCNGLLDCRFNVQTGL